MSIEAVEPLDKLRAGQHLCSFYENEDDQFSVVVPFIKSGLDKNERCIYIADDNSRSDVESLLKRNRFNPRRYIDSEQLVITSAKDVRLTSEEFSCDRVLDSLRSFLRTIPRNRYVGTRVASEMTWVLDKQRPVSRLNDYEGKITHSLLRNQTILLCQYNKSKFQETACVKRGAN